MRFKHTWIHTGTHEVQTHMDTHGHTHEVQTHMDTHGHPWGSNTKLLHLEHTKPVTSDPTATNQKDYPHSHYTLTKVVTNNPNQKCTATQMVTYTVVSYHNKLLESEKFNVAHIHMTNQEWKATPTI